MVELRGITKAGQVWTLDGFGAIRVPPSPSRKTTSWTACQCPLTAVHNALHPSQLTLNDWKAAAFGLGIEKALMFRIQAAADREDGHDADLRRRLLSACGLEGKT